MRSMHRSPFRRLEATAYGMTSGNLECRGCGITPADVPDGFEEQFAEAFEDGLCPACQLIPLGLTAADWIDMGEGASLDEEDHDGPL